MKTGSKKKQINKNDITHDELSTQNKALKKIIKALEKPPKTMVTKKN